MISRIVHDMGKGETPWIWHMRFEVRVLDVAIAGAAQHGPPAAGPMSM